MNPPRRIIDEANQMQKTKYNRMKLCKSFWPLYYYDIVEYLQKILYWIC